MKNFILALLLFTLPSLGIFAQKTPEKVVEVAYSLLGKKIKSGICNDFVVKVVAEVKNEKFSKVEEKLHNTYLFEKDRKDVRPGDVVRLVRYECSGYKATKHIAIVSKVTTEGIYVIHQNAGYDGKVREDLLCEENATGNIIFYSILGVK